MKRPACVVGCCLLFFLGLLFYLKMPEPFSDDSVSGRSIILYGTVCDKYQKKSSTYLIIKNAGSNPGKGSEEKHKVIVKLKESEESLALIPPLGSTVIVEGDGLLFSRARNPGNFDLALYEMIRGIDYEIYNAAILDAHDEGRGLNERLDEHLCILRERLSETLDGIYGAEDAGVIKAMLLGDRTGVDEEIKDRYRRSGMSHILCISSLHITLLGMAFLKLLRRTGLNKNICYIISFILTYMYGRLTGSGISTMRALITFGLMIAADLAGRTPDILSSMSIAAVIILLIRPLYVMDAGFILSFTAVSGIGLLSPAVRKLIPGGKKLCSSLCTALAVNLFMLPVTLYFFYQLPLFSIIINLAVIPLMGVLLVSAACSMIAGGIFIKAGIITGLPARLILGVYDLVTRLNDRIPFSLITPGKPELWQMVFYYLILISTVFVIERTEKPGRGSRLKAVTFVIIAIAIVTIRIRPPLAITMVDVGQGDCHLLETGRRRTVMIDCGSSDTDQVAKYRVIPYLMSRGYDWIDYAVLSHPDTDHVSGFFEMLDSEDTGVGIGAFIVPDMPDGNENYGKLLDLARKKGVRVFKIKTGDVFTVDNVCFTCLNPEKGAVFPDANEYSVCLSVTLKDSSFAALYTGDVEGEGEAEMIRSLPPDVVRYTLLKCAHHGSENSTPECLLDRISPACTFISAGVDNRYGHPHKELLRRLDDEGTRIYTTKDTGAVRMDTDGKKISITYFINQQEVKAE